MNKEQLQDLDYSEFISYLSNFALSVYGRMSIMNSKPVFNRDRLSDNLQLTDELFRLLENTNLNIPPIEDITPIIKESETGVLYPEKIQLIIDFQSVIGSIFIDCDEKYKRAHQFLEQLKPVDNLKILSSIIKDGKIRHDATEKLASIISKIESLKKTIYQKQYSLIRRLKQSDITATDDVLIRQDRYCIVIKTAKRHMVKGMLIDVSGSGASLFIDPNETIELNNRLAMLRAKEREEKLKILYMLTEKIRHNSDKLKKLAEYLGTLDKINAFYRYAVKYGCMLPEYRQKIKGFFLNGARHPLLVSLKSNVVANDIKQISKAGMVISGPNAGGKTVLLKTIGLSVLAFYSSIPIPVKANSWIGDYDNIFTIFGNKENMVESLSNFSSKLVNLKDIFENATDSSLVLIDEITEGTDPEAGGSLAISIFKSLLKKGVHFVSSTHLPGVSLWAATSAPENIEIAGVNFDRRTLMSTYKLEYGKISESHTFDIASRFLPKEIVEAAAKNNISAGTGLTKELIEKIDIYKQKLNELETIIERKRKESEILFGERKRWLEEKEKIRKQKMREIERIIKESEQKIRLLKNMPEIHKEIAVLKQMSREKADAAVQTENFSVGQAAKIKGTSIRGEIAEIKTNKVKIISSGKEIWIDKKEAIKAASQPKSSTKKISVTYQETGYQISCNLIGMHIDEAEEKLIRFLDNAILNDADTVVIVHGIGTGALKKMVSEILIESDFIADIRMGKPKEGGDGVTIAKFK